MNDDLISETIYNSLVLNMNIRESNTMAFLLVNLQQVSPIRKVTLRTQPVADVASKFVNTEVRVETKLHLVTSATMCFLTVSRDLHQVTTSTLCTHQPLQFGVNLFHFRRNIHMYLLKCVRKECTNLP